MKELSLEALEKVVGGLGDIDDDKLAIVMQLKEAFANKDIKMVEEILKSNPWAQEELKKAFAEAWG